MPARRALLSDKLQAFQWGLHIDSDAVDTLSGGLKRGVVGNNVIHFAVAMDTGALCGWDGGRLVASVMSIDSGQASANYIGDLQVADNTDAPSHSRIYQLWYRQTFHSSRHGATFKLRGGLIDLNENFLSVDAASVLLNSSFGVDPTLSANVPVSIYPVPGLGFEAAAQWPQWQWQLGIFQANPAHRNEGFQHGELMIGEMDYQTSPQDDAAAHMAIGLWRYRQSDPTLGAYPARDWGAYAFIEGPLSKSANAPQAFLQLGHAPDKSNTVTHYIGLGLQMPSPLKHCPNDIFSAGIAHAMLRNTAAGSETSFEISYQIALHRYMTLQPDLQYIRHPSGRLDIQDAVVAFVRLHLEFY
jgi:porin